jgi:hypothetical protein
MPNAIRQLLRKWVLTPDERTLVDADRDTVLRAMLSPEAWRLVESARRAGRYQPAPTITQEDAEAWETAMRSEVGLKVDTAMINWLHELAQRAISAAPADVLAEAKFALGCRAGWEMGKSISRLAAAQSSAPEDDATAAPDLEHHQP